MLVYGDPRSLQRTQQKLRRLQQWVASAGRAPRGLLRQGAWTTALIEAGELAQGILDAAFWRDGCDRETPEGRAALELLSAVARRDPEPPFAPLARAGLPERIEVRVQEGFAFYALYPEGYAEAARELPASSPVKVIGIRSIGTTLGAVVSAALGHREPPLTVRPVGPPFQRRLRLSDELRRELASHPGAFAVVDEGPGLSGSSFASVAEALGELGVSSGRVHFLASHAGGPGPKAAGAHRRIWGSVRVHVASWAGADPARWFEPLIGAPREVKELSGGRWRAEVLGAEERWPGVNIQQERRKLLVTAEGGRFLLRFAGLGGAGARKLHRARALAAEGLVPEVLGLRHGYSCERWIERREAPRRAEWVGAVARYLAFRAASLPAPEGSFGASLEDLLRMAIHNASLSLGEELAAELHRWAPFLPGLAGERRPTLVDGRMHAWEWVPCGPGRVLKADALDHCEGHDLVGAQDVAWDVAGAACELCLSSGERRRLVEEIRAATGEAPSERSLAFHEDAYLAFELGSHALARQALATSAPDEARRLGAEVERYARALRSRLAARRDRGVAGATGDAPPGDPGWRGPEAGRI